MEFNIRDEATRELSDIKLYARPFIQELHIKIYELLCQKSSEKRSAKNKEGAFIEAIMQTQSLQILQHNFSPSIQ